MHRERALPAGTVPVCFELRRIALAVGAAAVTLAAASTETAAVATIAGMPPVADPHNLYSETASGHMSAAVAGDLERIYVPNLRGNDVSVIDPAAMRVVDHFAVGRSPQHVVPSWDLRTLWVANNAERRTDGSLTPIDPRTGKSAIVVAEARRRLDFRDPHTMALQYTIETPHCGGINHADFSIDGRYAIFTCEFDGAVAKIDIVEHKVLGYLRLPMPATRLREGAVAKGAPTTEVCSAKKGMPQDIRIAPDGKRFYVADMDADGLHVLDGDAFTEVGFITTGVGTHGLYPSRDGTRLFIANRGSHKVHGPPHGSGSVSVLDFATGTIVAQWPIPGGGSPDMGNVSADGRALWLSGRFDNVVYRIDTASGAVTSIAVGQEPHGLAVWPLPGRYSLGHTGNLR